jgi:asparagine synthase (glutamine-hydrolysing)
MCGLAGLFDSRARSPIDPALLSRMTDSLAHRGPDGSGLHIGAGIGLGHRRLSIIDLAGGSQPMANETGRVIVVFNGEIYNFRELAAELSAAGHRFQSHSDTEVIVHGWEEWGPDCVRRFDGMFAIALWDEDRQTLFLARDHLGKKPLYWSVRDDGMVAFASELKALAPCPGLSRSLDPQAVEDFFAYGYVPDPRSIFAGIGKLPPAHSLVWRRGDAAPLIADYWTVDFAAHPGGNAADRAADLRSRLLEATRARLVADVPLGAFLSGGLDSSAVVALMAQSLAQPVQSFAIGFEDPAYDESPYAQRVAERYHTDHHVRIADPEDVGLVERLAGIYDEPFGDSSAMPTYLLCRAARERVTVALSGDGGDEVFAGYRRQAMHLRTESIRRRLPGPLRRPLFGALAALYPKADWAPRRLRAKTTFQELACDSAEAYFRAVSALNDETRARLFSPAFKRRLGGYRAQDLLRGHMDRLGGEDPLRQIQYADLKTWLAGGILVKVDRASMANSLEVRSPLLDHRLVAYGLSLPAGDKIRDGRGKALLKDAMRGDIDIDLIERRKQGFSVPLARWFRGPLRTTIESLATSERLGDSGLFAMDEIASLVARHLSGRSDHATALWLLLMFDAFLANQMRAMPP